MRLSDRNPAVYAGLLSMGMWANPVPALALQTPHVAARMTIPWVEIGVGCVAGAALSGAVYLSVSLVSDYLEERERRAEGDMDEKASTIDDASLIPVDTDELKEQRAQLISEHIDTHESIVAKKEAASASGQVKVGKHSAEKAVKHAAQTPQEPVAVEPSRSVPAQVSGRHMAASKQVETPAHTDEKVVAARGAHAKRNAAEVVSQPVTKAVSDEARRSARARLASLPTFDKIPAAQPSDANAARIEVAAPQTKAEVERPSAVRRGPRFKNVEVSAERAPKATSRASHFSGQGTSEEVQPKSSRAPRFKAEASRSARSATAGQMSAGKHLKSSPLAVSADKDESGSMAILAANAPRPMDDYADVAEKYVKKTTLAQRISARAAGVAGVLSSRINTGMLDDLPIIARSDGTVADLGTSWWDSAMGDSVRRVSEVTNDDLPEVSGSLQGSYASSSASIQGSYASSSASRSSGSASPAPRRTMTDGEKRSAYISKSVAEVRVGMYPEHRSAEELDQDDMWERALRAMGEHIEREHGVVPPPIPVFTDVITPADLIDESDGLDGSTDFIPFKKPAGHPEVVDSSTYVDYLIGDEFSKNSSDAVRKSSADYLRVIRGGSQKSRPLPVQRAHKEYAPKHFAGRSSSLSLVGA